MVKFDLIAAVCENMGIGKNGDLPWRLKKEMAFFTRMTSETVDQNKQNVVLMGRRTWDCIPKKFKPLQNRINFVLSRSKLNLNDAYENVYSFTNLDEVVAKLKSEQFASKVENVWVIGGSHIYKETMESKYFHRLYLTKVLAHFDCDTFFPKFSEHLVKVSDPRVPEDEEEENGIKFVYNIFENPDFKEE